MEKKNVKVAQEQNDTQAMAEVKNATQELNEAAAKKEKIKKIGIFAGIGTALVGAGLLLGKVIFGGSDDSEDAPIITEFVDDNNQEEE